MQGENMEKKIQNILFVCDVISYIMTFWEIFIAHSYSFGTILGFISILLSCMLSLLKKVEKITRGRNNIFLRRNKQVWYKNYFYILTGIYIICNGSILTFSILSGTSTFIVIFLIFIAIPICYSLLTLGSLLFEHGSCTTYRKIQSIVAPFPHIIMLIACLFIDGIFLKVLCVIFVGLLYAPVGQVTLYVNYKLE